MSSTSSHSSFSSDSSYEEGEFRADDLSLLIPSYRRLFRDLERDVQNNASRRALKPLVDKINGLSCPICMENFQVGSEVRQMPCHECHSHCIKSWLEENRSCPTCRTEVESRNSREQRNRSSESSERQDEDERNSRPPPPENSNRRSRSRSPQRRPTF
ncbi:uncharacterized protein LOC131050175 [Cryptomeria japonica]|uniref:uncharacterized protein LOC131050175 n=1 Tax=Cryptomeria japonica TaxID=3369 RepID=UPI0025AC8FD5|nr:uncharacterized protein LOC131050175 [Cryptomeria japonica]